jgi:hypothetical protein
MKPDRSLELDHRVVSSSGSYEIGFSGLRLTKRKALGAAADNINVIPTTGDLVVAGS